MIYSPAFDALPAEARRAVYARMRDVIENRGDTATMEILAETRPEWSATAAMKR
jgi:hypothetical protein